jgi:hypothetical protein
MGRISAFSSTLKRESKMSENYDDELDEQDEIQEGNTNEKSFVADLRRQAKEGKSAKKEAEDAKAQLASLQRESAFMKAGVDLDTPLGKMFAKGYDGELSVDAIKQAGSAVGALPTSADPGIQAELAAHDRVAQASAGTAAAVPDTVFDEIKNAKWGDVNAVLEIARKAGSTISFDDKYEWVSPPR